jgi:hypothetical protein
MRPPQRAVYLDVRGSDGQLPRQVFEYTAVFRNIATPGTYRQFRQVRHPTSGGFIDRRLALARIIDVPPEVQARINAERLLRCLPPEEGLNEDDNTKLSNTMVRMTDSTIDPSEVGADDIGNEMEGLVGVVLPGPHALGRSPVDFEARRRAAAARLEEEQSSSDEDVAPQLPILNGGATRTSGGRDGRGVGIQPRSSGGRVGVSLRGSGGRARRGPPLAQLAVAQQLAAGRSRDAGGAWRPHLVSRSVRGWRGWMAMWGGRPVRASVLHQRMGSFSRAWRSRWAWRPCGA